MARFFSKKYAEKVQQAELKFEEAKVDHSAKLNQARIDFALSEQNEQERVDAYNKDIDQVADAFLARDHDAVVYFFRSLIAKTLTSDIDAVSAEVGYAPDSLHLVVDLEMPDFSIIPEETAFKFIKNGDRIEPALRSPAKRRAFYGSLICQIALKCIDTIFRGGANVSAVHCLTLNGMLDAVDPATGQDIRVCLLSVRVTSDDFAKLNLRQVQPEQCLRMLKASVSRSPAELVPVKPIVELDMVDPRFIDSADVLSELDSRPNLMELTPGEFESLITNLFEKMGQLSP